MTNLEKVRVMSSEKFEELSQTTDSQLCFVEASNYIKGVLSAFLKLNFSGRQNCAITNSNRTYNITADGLIIGSLCIGNNTSPVTSITRNGVAYKIYDHQGSSNEVVTNCLHIPVQAGDILSITGGTLNDVHTYIYLYPIIIEA